MTKPKIVILTGAGVSKESGIATFRDVKDGLWNNYRIEDVATGSGWKLNPGRVLQFYNERRKEVMAAQPNDMHRFIASLEKDFNVQVFTQNVDDFHERAGSTRVFHVHGSLFRMREHTWNGDTDIIYTDCFGDITLDDKSAYGVQWRPDVVFFDEFVRYFDEAKRAVQEADAVIIVGTSLQVIPFAFLPEEIKFGACGIIVDPNPTPIDGYWAIPMNAVESVPLLEQLLSDALEHYKSTIG